jgi:hypothetical protein
MRFEDSRHVGDFLSQCSSCFFFVNNPEPGENLIQMKAEIFTPRNWQNTSFTGFVELADPFYHMGWIGHV